jgi:hypothetical protein
MAETLCDALRRNGAFLRAGLRARSRGSSRERRETQQPFPAIAPSDGRHICRSRTSQPAYTFKQICSERRKLPMVGVTMNVYNRATGWGTFLTLVLLAGMLVLDVWLMGMLPTLQHGLRYAVLQLGLLGVFLIVLRLIFRGGSRKLP